MLKIGEKGVEPGDWRMRCREAMAEPAAEEGVPVDKENTLIAEYLS